MIPFDPHGSSKNNILWMNEILHHFETIGSHCWFGFFRGIMVLGFLRRCRILSIRSMSSSDRFPLKPTREPM